MAMPIARARKHFLNKFNPLIERCSCGAPHDEHSGGKHSGGHPNGCRRYRSDIADQMVHRAVSASGSSFLGDLADYHARVYPRPKPKDGGWHVGPSDVNSCPKFIQLRERPPEGFVPEPEDTSAAMLGSMYHDALTRARALLYTDRTYEFPVTIPGLDRTGRGDEYDQILAEVTDYKTCGRYAWKRLGLYGPRGRHWEQVAVYASGLIAAGYPVDQIRLMYINRETGEDEQFVIPYREALARIGLGRLRYYNAALDLGEDLPRDPNRTGPSSDPLCARCPVRRACWNMDAAEAAGRSPESYTILGADPDVEAIEWAAKRLYDANTTKKDAIKEQKASSALLKGLSGGEYGDWEVVERSRAMPDWKAWATLVQRARERYLATAERARGDFAEWVDKIEVPKRIDSWTEVKPQRYAAKNPTTPAPEEEGVAA